MSAHFILLNLVYCVNAMQWLPNEHRSGESATILVVDDQTNSPETLSDLYPDLTPKQLKEVEENLDAYIRIVREIANRVFSEQANAEEENTDEEN